MSLPSKKTAVYGAWESPISSEFVVAQAVGLSELQIDSGCIYWLESRPNEKGRTVIVRMLPDGSQEDVVPADYNCRSRVHELGGGAYLAAGVSVYFSNYSDNGVYKVRAGGEPELILLRPDCRFADFILDSRNGSLIALCEDHTNSPNEATNSIVRLDLASGDVCDIVSGADFYASPRLSPDGSQLAWLSWNHPNMPWDSSFLSVASNQSNGKLTNVITVAGGTYDSIFHPEWSPTGVLHFASDPSGWWNLYRYVDGSIEALWAENAEFGEAQWVFRQSTYAFLNDLTILCTYVLSGVSHLATIDLGNLSHVTLDLPFTVIGYVSASEGIGYFVGASATQPSAIVSLEVTTGRYKTLKASRSLTIDQRYLSVPESIEFPTKDGQTAFANYYPPTNADFTAPDGALPPLLIACHGGPTGISSLQFSPIVQFWTSRGFAFAQVNYGGSTGYGRAYRERLNGQWGVIDVDDCVRAALYLAESQRVDRTKLTIHGGSAGGYTALCALTFYDVFAAGASLYGIGDVAALAKDTHKFESRYMDSLIGPYPEKKELYEARSPLRFANKLSSPVIFFQGLDDKIVPPSQSETMVRALKAKHVPVAYLAFEGEGHGFRNSANIIRYLEAMLYFYGRVLDIPIVDIIDLVPIDGLA
jgi:dipeptidyl aminopeptidase/acylaminoacyl peptidase